MHQAKLPTMVAYIDSKLFPFCPRLCGIFKVWCCCIRIRGCSGAANHLLREAGFKLHATKRPYGLVLYGSSLGISNPRMASNSAPATYHGHRQHSYFAVDTGELVELRARQRTFDNAYLRTCVINLGYSAIILKLFDARFYSSTHSTLGEINISV
jgi:hypothetical protein